jgi:hypothetical protein
MAFKDLRQRLADWWYGIPIPRLELHDDGGMEITYQDPNYTPARARAHKAMKTGAKWGLGVVGAIIVAVASAAVIKSLGLS